MIGFLEVLRVFDARGRVGQFASLTEVVVNGLEVPQTPGRGVPSRITAAARARARAAAVIRDGTPLPGVWGTSSPFTTTSVRDAN